MIKRQKINQTRLLKRKSQSIKYPYTANGNLTFQNLCGMKMKADESYYKFTRLAEKSQSKYRDAKQKQVVALHKLKSGGFLSQKL
jgi:hypothetical protein